MINQQAIQMLLANLSPEELQQVDDVLVYLQEKAGAGGSGQMAEGSVASLLNKQSPAVRQAFQRLSELAETPREMPFAPKLSERDHFNSLGLDPTASENVKAALDGVEVLGRVQQRLGGTDADRPPEPLTRRDVIAAALENYDV